MAFDLDLGITVVSETIELSIAEEETLDLDIEESGEADLEMDGVQVHIEATQNHSKLTHRDKPDQHPIEAITGLREELDNLGSGSGGGGTTFKVGHGLKMEAENTLCVDAVDDFEGDNTLPITAAAVQEMVGNIEILLDTI